MRQWGIAGRGGYPHPVEKYHWGNRPGKFLIFLGFFSGFLRLLFQAGLFFAESIVLSNNFGNIGDFFPESDVPCRIRGCKNKIHISGQKNMYNKASGNDRGRQVMCEECWEAYQNLQDQEVPCSKPGCDGKWVWNRFGQLEARAQGRTGAPKGFCEKCLAEMRGKGDIAQPCRIKGCKNTWMWTRRMQMESKDGRPPRRLCDDCYKISATLADQELRCRIKGCNGKVVWTRHQQLEYLRGGNKLENPPRRMCDSCLERSKKLEIIHVPCRVKGCKNTWAYTPADQLEVLHATPEGKEPVVPQRMCQECLSFFNSAKDQEQPCSNHGCTHKWVWSRMMQLHRRINGGKGAPRRMCDHCQQRLQELKPIEQPCREEGCTGTWTYLPDEQLRDSLAKRQPAKRHCKGCSQFLAAHQPELLHCSKCGDEFSWSVHEQLMTHLGTFAKPELCAKCNSMMLEGMPSTQSLITPGPRKEWRVTIPNGGAWRENPATRDWPAGMTAETIAKMEDAHHRIVCIGDELTAPEAGFESWVELLAQQLQGKLSGGATQLLNVGMAGTTAEMACRRFQRDVAPFGPEIVIFSFAFAEAFSGSEFTPEHRESMMKALQEFKELAEKLPTAPRLICWLPNPVYPQQNNNSLWHGNPEPDTNAVRNYETVLRATREWCAQNQVQVVDAKAMFEMVGLKTAMSWMASWCRPDATGARTLAGWMAEAILNP